MSGVCEKIQVLTLPDNTPSRYLENGAFFLDTDEEFSLLQIEKLPLLDDLQTLGYTGTIGTSVPRTEKNDWVLNPKINPTVFLKSAEGLNIIASVGAQPLRQDVLYVIKETDRYEIQIDRGEAAWATRLDESVLSETQYEDWTISRTEILDEIWEIPGYQDGDRGFNMLVGDLGAWTLPERNSGGPTYQPITVQDLLPLHSPLYILRNLLCQYGWTFESPLLETEEWRRKWALLLRNDYLSTPTTLKNLRFKANVIPPQAVSANAIFADEAFDYSNHYNNNTGVYAPGFIVTDLYVSITIEYFGNKDSVDVSVIFLKSPQQSVGEGILFSQLVTLQKNVPQVVTFELEDVVLFPGESVKTQIIDPYTPFVVNNVRLLSGYFYNDPKERPIGYGDLVNPGEFLTGDVSGLELLKAMAHLTGGIVETDWVYRRVVLRQPYTTDVYNETDIEGHFTDTEIDLRPQQFCDTESPENNRDKKRQLLLQFAEPGNDEAIKQLRLPKTAPLHSRKIDFGPGYIAGIENSINPVFQATLNDFNNRIDYLGKVPVDLPRIWDNDSGNRTKAFGYRIFHFHGRVYHRGRDIDGNATSDIARAVLLPPTEQGQLTVATNRIPYFYQLPNAIITAGLSGTPIVPKNNIVFGYQETDLWQLYLKRWIPEYRTGEVVKVIAGLDAYLWRALDFRGNVAIDYRGRKLLTRLLERSQYNGCTESGTNLELLAIGAVAICADDIMTEPAECVNTVTVFIANVGDGCNVYSYGGSFMGTISGQLWEYRVVGDPAWTPLGTGLTALLCNLYQQVEVRVTVSFEEPECADAVGYLQQSPCENDVTCKLVMHRVNGEWCFELVINDENLTCPYIVEATWTDGSLNPQLLLVGQYVCNAEPGAYITATAAITLGGICAGCPPIVLKCYTSIPPQGIIPGDPDYVPPSGSDCLDNNPKLVILTQIVQGTTAYRFAIGGNYVCDISTFIVSYSTNQGVEGNTWMPGDGPLTLGDGVELTAYATVIWCNCDCPPTCTPVVTKNSVCDPPYLGQANPKALCV